MQGVSKAGLGVGGGGKAMKYYEYEMISLQQALKAEREQVRRLRAYCRYLGNRMIQHAITLNESNPIISASILDDLEDALAVSRIGER
jgi:hypothetical protein